MADAPDEGPGGPEDDAKQAAHIAHLSAPGSGGIRWPGEKVLERGMVHGVRLPDDLPRLPIDNSNANSSDCILYVQPDPIRTVPFQQLFAWGLGRYSTAAMHAAASHSAPSPGTAVCTCVRLSQAWTTWYG